MLNFHSVTHVTLSFYRTHSSLLSIFKTSAENSLNLTLSVSFIELVMGGDEGMTVTNRHTARESLSTALSDRTFGAVQNISPTVSEPSDLSVLSAERQFGS